MELRMAPLCLSPVSNANCKCNKGPGGRRWRTHTAVCLFFRPRPARLTWDRLKWNSIFRSFSSVCCTFGRRRDLVPRCRLYFAHSEETTAGERVEVCLRGLVSYDEPQCKALPEAHLPAVQ